jgi:hypothetical protein
MGKSERERGKRGEREVAAIEREFGFDAHRGVQYHGGAGSPDVTGLPGFHQEVKLVNRLDLNKAIQQSKDDCGEDEDWCVIHRRDREEWKITLDFRTFLGMVRDLNEKE